MTAEVGTLATYIATVNAAAVARGVTSADVLARVRVDAIDQWYSRLNTSTGVPD